MVHQSVAENVASSIGTAAEPVDWRPEFWLCTAAFVIRGAFSFVQGSLLVGNGWSYAIALAGVLIWRYFAHEMGVFLWKRSRRRRKTFSGAQAFASGASFFVFATVGLSVFTPRLDLGSVVGTAVICAAYGLYEGRFCSSAEGSHIATANTY